MTDAIARILSRIKASQEDRQMVKLRMLSRNAHEDLVEERAFSGQACGCQGQFRTGSFHHTCQAFRRGGRDNHSQCDTLAGKSFFLQMLEEIPRAHFESGRVQRHFAQICQGGFRGQSGTALRIEGAASRAAQKSREHQKMACADQAARGTTLEEVTETDGG